MMKSERLDYKIIQDYEQMYKLGYSLNNNVVPALNNFQEFASDTYNYLIQPCIASPRYKAVLSTDGEWYDVVQDTKVCKYFYETEEPDQPFLKNEPSFFRYYDYLKTVSSDILSTDQTFYIAKNCISKFPVPNYVIYGGVSSVTQDGEVLSSPSISSCWSPVLLDNQNARWYQSLWNSFFKVVTKPNIIETDEWKVSSPVINNTDNSFNSLLNLTWTVLSAYHVSSDMNRQYYDSQMYPGPYYPVTRYCQTYDKIMMSDNLNRTEDTDVYLWEKEHMSSPYFYFWKPIADFIGDSLPGFPITRQAQGITLTYENQFVQNNNDSKFIVGGNNTISVGLDDYGWNHMRPDYSKDLSTWSWLSKPYRTTDVSEYQEGQGSYLVFSYNTSGYVQRYGNPKIQPPKKVVAQNLYALAYYWNKFLSPIDEDGNPNLEQYYSTAIGTQHIPFRQMDREENLTVTWTLHPILSATDISGCIGFMEITQNIVKEGTGWISSEINDNSFSFYREGNSGEISSSPQIQDGLYVLYGDLQGVQVIGADLSSVTLVYTQEKDEYFKQYLKLFPKSQEEQRRQELSTLKEDYDAKLSALCAEMDQAISALSDIEEYKQEIIDNCYYQAYGSAWQDMGRRYENFKGDDISSFIEFANNPPYAEAVSGDFDNIDDLDYKGKLFKGINEYISSDAYLSTYGSVDSIEDLDEIYNAFILASDLSSTYIQTIAGICKEVNDLAIDKAYRFLNIEGKELTQESVLDFASRLNTKSSSVGELWRIFLEDYVNENLDTMLDQYYRELQWVQDWISDILARMDYLTQKYEEDKADIYQKEYPIDLPDFSKLDLLYEKRYSYDASVTDGNGWISLSRWVSVKMGVEDGQLEQEADYDGMRYRYPYSYENEPNEALEKASYLLYGMRTRYGLNLEDQITEVKPFVFQNCHSYDQFRRDGIKSIENEIKSDVGYHSKDLWWKGDYSEDELRKFNLSATVLLYGEESQGTWTPVARDLGSPVIVHIINGDDGSKMMEFEAEKIAVDAFFNSEGGIKTQSLNMNLRYDVPSTLGKSPEQKIKEEDFVKVDFILLPQVMCEAKWICQQ